MVNRYDQASPYEYVSQYVPVPFQELVTLGKYYADERKAAEKELSNYIKKAGEFHSLITKDNESYQNIAFNEQLKNRINEAMINPSVMRSAAWRSGLLGDLNSIDYASLSKLKASAESAKLYDAAVRKLALEGKMPPGWEPDYFGTYSTIDSGKVFNETPLPYTTINDMVHKYVNDLKPEYINTRGGYDYFGVSDARAEAQVDINRSELLARPDVQRMIGMYQSAGMSKEEAENAFFIQAKNEAREKAYENRTPNQYALLDAKAKYDLAVAAAKNKGKNGSEDDPHLTRRQLIDYDLANKTNKWVKENPELIAMQPSLRSLKMRAEETGSQEDINAFNNAYNEFIMGWQTSADNDRSNYMKSEFEKTAHFKPTEDPQNNKNYSRNGYLRGTKAAVKSISGTIGFNSADNKGDILLTSIGGVPQEYTTNRGNKQNVYEFASSAGFVLPEELFAQGTGSNRDTVERSDWWFTADDPFPFKQSLEEGRLQNVQFIPDNFENVVQMGNTKYVAGKLRIPVNDIENEFGAYIGSAMPFSTQSTRSSLKEYFGAKEITYGEDNKYYEIDIYRALPSDNSAEYWNRVNGIFENTPSHGGIGGATQAADMVLPSQESILSVN